ncbi:hypothetical protein LCGC14_2968750, partial [marine sediment metagenome]
LKTWELVLNSSPMNLTRKLGFISYINLKFEVGLIMWPSEASLPSGIGTGLLKALEKFCLSSRYALTLNDNSKKAKIVKRLQRRSIIFTISGEFLYSLPVGTKLYLLLMLYENNRLYKQIDLLNKLSEQQ